MKGEKTFFSARNVTFLAVLVALVVVLQVFGGYFKIGATSLSFVLVPIVLGGLLVGVWAGGLIGLLFGLITLVYGITGADAFTGYLFAAHPVLTSVICLGKGLFAGLAAGGIYKLVSAKNRLAAVFVASATAPIVNTGLFILGAFCMMGTISELADGQSVVYFLFIVCAGVNFLIEVAINLICAPALYTVENLLEKRVHARG